MHTTLKTYSYYNIIKLRRLLQHVSVYKETIIRVPQKALSRNYTLGSMWIHRAKDVVSVMAA
jgi:hypothetical protein